MLSLIKEIYLRLHNINNWPFNQTPEVKGGLFQSVTLHVGLHFFHYNLICNMTTFRKGKKWPFDPIPGVEGVHKDSIFAFIVLCAQFPLIWYATWLLSENDMVLPFHSPTPRVEGVSISKIFATMLMHVSLAIIWYATWPYSIKV